MVKGFFISNGRSEHLIFKPCGPLFVDLRQQVSVPIRCELYQGMADLVLAALEGGGREAEHLGGTFLQSAWPSRGQASPIPSFQ